MSKMADKEIGAVIEVLVDKRDPRFLQFLCNLCVCDERPIPSTQRMLLILVHFLKYIVFLFSKLCSYNIETSG